MSAEPYYSDDDATLLHGDCRDVLPTLPDASVDAVVCDPPYGLGFMGKEWDRIGDTGRGSRVRAERSAEFTPTGEGHSTSAGPYLAAGIDSLRSAGRPFQDWCEQWATECLRVLKPGGYLLAFGGTRTYHRLACAIEDAGFEIRDSISWLYGSGFAKSWNFGTQYSGEWCDCTDAKPVGYSHANRADMHRLRNDLHPPAVPREAGEGADLFTPLQRNEPRTGLGDSRAQGARSVVAGSGGGTQGEDDRRIESVMEGRDVHRTGQGLPDGSDAGTPEGASERVRGGALARDGGDDRTTGRAPRGSASRQRGASGQPPGEPPPVSGPHVALDDGALRDGPVCARCGGLDPSYLGFGTALKPAHEPIVVGRKPLVGTVAANVAAHGTGALNIDGCRVEGEFVSGWSTAPGKKSVGGILNITDEVREARPDNAAGRWPTNVLIEETQTAELDRQSGYIAPGNMPANRSGIGFGSGAKGTTGEAARLGGGASRFFPTFRYEAKAPTHERPSVGGVLHPTVKPLDLMRWLVRLVTPRGGTVLDPFAGSGTTGEACILEGFDCILIEREADYLPLIRQRLAKPAQVGFDFGEPA